MKLNKMKRNFDSPTARPFDVKTEIKSMNYSFAHRKRNTDAWKRILSTSKFQDLYSCTLINCGFDDTSCEILCRILTLRSVCVQDNALTHRSAQFLAGCNLHFLDVSGNSSIRSQGASALAHSTSVCEMNLNACEIGNQGALDLFANLHIKKLELRHNKIGSAGLKTLVNNHTLLSLDLQYNRIGPGGARYLGKNTSLKHLFVGSNLIADKGCKKLRHHTALQEVDLSQNNLSNSGFLSLGSIRSLTRLNLFHNQINLNVDLQMSLINLTVLDLSHNNISWKHSNCLHSLILQLPALASLNLSANHLIEKPREEIEKECLSWNTQKKINFNLWGQIDPTAVYSLEFF